MIQHALPGFLSFVAVMSLLGGCEPPDDGNANGNASGVKITGTIPQETAAISFRDGEYTLDDAAKVFAFSPPVGSHGWYSAFYDIVDGSFTANVEMGTAVALIFLTANDEYIGHLRVGDLNLLPLGNLSEGENTVIDLATLSLDGTQVSPGHDPLGSEILISDAELLSLAQVDGFYEALSKNLDTDHDGEIDYLDQRQLFVSNYFDLYVGEWGVDDSPPGTFDASNYHVNYFMQIQGGANLVATTQNVVLSGPLDDPYSDIEALAILVNPGFCAKFWRMVPPPPGSPFGSAGLPFRKGTYSLLIDGTEQRTFEFSNLDAEYHLVIVSPTLHTDGVGQVTDITFEFSLPSGLSIEPTALLAGMAVQLFDWNNTQLIARPVDPALWSGQFALPSPIALSSLKHGNFLYNDLLGNEYAILWSAPAP